MEKEKPTATNMRAAVLARHLGMLAEEQRGAWRVHSGCIAKPSRSLKREVTNAVQSVLCHHLGIISLEEGDFAAAVQWCRKSLAIKEKLGDEHGAAITYHALGVIGRSKRTSPRRANRIARVAGANIGETG